MKIKGMSFDSPRPSKIVVGCGDEEVVLFAQPVLDFSEFEAIVPLPEPREVLTPDKKRVKDFKHPDYVAGIQDYGMKRTYWMVIKSLEATEGLEWDKVTSDPATWHFVEEELTKAFTPIGANKIVRKVCAVNGLDDEMMKQARESFLV